jgi:hypothetical protein
MFSAAQESDADLAITFYLTSRGYSVDIVAYLFNAKSKQVFSKHGRRQSMGNIDSIFQSLFRTVLWGDGTSINVVEESRRKLEAQCAAQPERC